MKTLYKMVRLIIFQWRQVKEKEIVKLPQNYSCLKIYEMICMLFSIALEIVI